MLTKKGVEKIQEEHQHVIEEKDAALPLNDNDLQESDNQVEAIKYENVGLQGEIYTKDQQIER